MQSSIIQEFNLLNEEFCLYYSLEDLIDTIEIFTTKKEFDKITFKLTYLNKIILNKKFLLNIYTKKFQIIKNNINFELITNSTNALTLEISDITQQYFNIIEMIALENFKKEQKEVLNIKQILTTFLN